MGVLGVLSACVVSPDPRDTITGDAELECLPVLDAPSRDRIADPHPPVFGYVIRSGTSIDDAGDP